MPPRTNREQEVIALLRRMLAQEGCEVEEQIMLHDPGAGIDREVDVVMRCQVSEDVTITVSCEVVDHRDPMDVTWVEQQLSRHSRMETDRLILVSWSGFTKAALQLGAASRNPVTQMVHVQRDAGGSMTLFQDEVALTPRKVVLVLDTPDGGVCVRALIDQALFLASGERLPETARDLALLLLDHPNVVRTTLTEAHNHPERDDLRSFNLSMPLPEAMQLFLRKEPSGELHRITQVEIVGEFQFSQTAFDMEVARFGEIPFAHARTELGGRAGIIVARLGEHQELLPGFMARVYPEGEEPKPARGDRGT